MAIDEQDEQLPITRGEFHRWLRRATVGYVILAVGAVVSAALLVDVFQKFETESLNRDEAIRISQIAACQDLTGAGSANRTAIIRAIRNQNRNQRSEIEENKRIPQQFFPNIPPAEFKRLIRDQIKTSRGVIKENKRTIGELVAQEACRKRYGAPLPEA